jgi:hypothetical protein
MVAKWWNETYPAISAWGHGILDVVGMVGDAVPGVGNIVAAVADILNVIWYAAEGDWTNAGLSAIAIIPYIGSAAKGGKYLGKGLKYVDDIVKLVSKYGDDVIKLFSKYGTKLGELFVKYGDDVIKVFAKYGDDAFKWLAKYGDDLIKWLAKQGDEASKFTDEALEKIFGKKAKKEIGEEASEEVKEKALKEGKEQAGELLNAIAQAKIFTEINDANGTPVPVLISSLNTGFKRQYPVLKTHNFEYRLKVPGHYKIIMRSEEVSIDDDYTPGSTTDLDITDQAKSGNKTKPQGENWKQTPNWNKWTESGGTIQQHSDGSVTLIAKDGTAVKYSPDGYPDFKPHLNHPSGVTEVPIEGGFSKSRTPDYRKANEAAGHPEWGNRAPKDYTWHHHQDGNTMQLVPKEIHRMFGHSGGVANL